MIFYLGHKIEEPVIDNKTRLIRNKAKQWKYGYDESIDTVIISKDGTLGEVYVINGLKIGFPQCPKHKDILNWDKTQINQKWERQEMPKGLNDETQFDIEYSEFIEEQFKRREEGLWIYINGIPIYITGVYWFFIQWIREGSKYPRFRIIQSELMIFWEACKADERCYGINYVKNRRFGWSALCFTELIYAGTQNEDKILGMISKKGKDAKKIFNRMIRSFKRLPCFFLPVWDGTTTPKTELILSEPTKKRKAGEKIDEGEGLNTEISWHNTEMNAMDGEEIFRSMIDEAGKFPKDVPFSEYWSVVQTSHTIGSDIVGRAMVGSTVNALKKGGAEYKSVYDDSNPSERTENGETKSGLYRIFIPAKYCLAGFFDVYGFSIVENPEKPLLNDLNKIVKIGSKTYLKNKLDALINTPDKYNERLRQFPDSDRDAFRDEASDCSFNLMKIMEQIDHNENELSENEVERGNFTWKDGIQDSEVIWRPDSINGRFWIARGCHPSPEFRNKKEKKMINGVLAWAPTASHIGSIGVDPYNRSKTVDGRGSLGAIHLFTKTNTSHLPNETFILEYLDRPRTVELFYEDLIMVSHYYSMPFLCELSNEKILKDNKDRGYRHFSMNNPFKSFKDLSPTELELGGAPPQDTKIGDQQFYAIEAYIEDYIGVARDNSKRLIGEMGYMPFTRTLTQWKDVDPTARTKYDAYISSSLAIIANQKRIISAPPPEKPIGIPFERFDNTGLISIR